MSLSIGIVGLPNVGKSTLFNALVKNAQAEASNYPFCTIDPNVGVVEVPDSRLAKLTEISKSKKTVPTTIEFIDIAGLVKGAHKGEGLGNKFLSHVKETDAIAMVVRFFKNSDIVHVAGKIEPAEDIKTIQLELILSDLNVIEKTFERMRKELKAGDNETKKKIAILEKIKEGLENELPVWAIFPNSEDLAPIKEIQLLTSKPVLYIANVSEDMAGASSEELIEKYNLQEIIKNPESLIPISAKVESELGALNKDEQGEFLESLGLKESGLARLIHAAYSTLGLITYLTSGEQETRAWTIKKGSTAPQAAGVIHTDFERGFIAAEVIKYEDFIQYNGWAGCKEKGLIKTEGKTYIVQDGDIVLFRFNV
ncbi:MAG: redox-regulated ATPase YchF [Patescibacteria group bacterium]